MEAGGQERELYVARVVMPQTCLFGKKIKDRVSDEEGVSAPETIRVALHSWKKIVAPFHRLLQVIFPAMAALAGKDLMPPHLSQKAYRVSGEGEGLVAVYHVPND